MNKGLKWLIAVLSVFAIATAIGAFFSIKTDPELIYDYFKELSGGEISIHVGGAVLSALAVWLVLFFSAFFKFGAVTTAATIATRGFVDGYSVTAILRVLGMKGVPLCFFDIFGVPLVILMAANVMCTLTLEESKGVGYLLRSVLLLLAMFAAVAIYRTFGGQIMTMVLTKFEF